MRRISSRVADGVDDRRRHEAGAELLLLLERDRQVGAVDPQQLALVRGLAGDVVLGPFVVGVVGDGDLPPAQRALDVHDVAADAGDPAAENLGRLRWVPLAALANVRHRYRYVPALAGMISDAGLAALRSDPLVESIDLDEAGGGHLAQSVPALGADVVHQAYGFTGKNVTVAVLDTGVDTTHPDLSACQRIIFNRQDTKDAKILIHFAALALLATWRFRKTGSCFLTSPKRGDRGVAVLHQRRLPAR